MRPRLLDPFCGQGGGAMGYHRAGFDVVGIDIAPQPRYPFEFIRGDAIELMPELLSTGYFAGVHASCPCQRYSDTQRIQGREHPDLIAETRRIMQDSGLPYVIENVPGARAELRDPVMLCGAMFGLPTYRHRLFETSFPVTAPEHPEHIAPQAKMGRPPQPGEFIQCVGNFSGVPYGRKAMGMPWASREGLREAIPPAYTTWIGEQLMSAIQGEVPKMTAVPPNEMPYKRGSGCDLCGEPGPLRRVVLKESSGSMAARNYKAARVAYVCGHHLDSDPAFEPRAPRATFAPGTSRQEPQKERLW